MLLVSPSVVHAHVVCHFHGRLGNQLFQAAAAIALAQENQCGVYFPDFEKLDDPTEDYGLNQLKDNYKYIFQHIPHLKEKVSPIYVYREEDFAYHPIPYNDSIEIDGYFISEKYFSKHSRLIIDLFSPSAEIETVLEEKFKAILKHPNSVAIHVRTGYLEYKLNSFDPNFYKNFLPPDLEYIKKAIELFDDDALFVVFSDHLGWCKENLTSLNKQFVFIEDQEYIYDFYLLSKCKHAIISNSTFSWWTAYLNKNPEKKIAYRIPFWALDAANVIDISLPGGVAVLMNHYPPIPHFRGAL